MKRIERLFLITSSVSWTVFLISHDPWSFASAAMSTAWLMLRPND